MFTVVSTDGSIVMVETRYRARGAARAMSTTGRKAVVVSNGELIALASNGRILPAKWWRRWSGEARREWAKIAEGVEIETRIP